MRFIVDTNLPPAVASWIATMGHEAQHTKDLGLEQAKDGEIWRYARIQNAMIVTKDEDFALLRAAQPDGPSVIWIRVGNAVRRVILARLVSAWPAIEKALGEGQGIVEVR